MTTPRNPVEVRIQQRGLGYRGVQVLAYVKDATAPLRPYQIKRALGFDVDNDAAVLRVIIRLERRGLLRRLGQGCHNVTIVLGEAA